MNNYETQKAYNSALWKAFDELESLQKRIHEESYRTEFPDQASQLTQSDVFAMETVAKILATLCPVSTIRIKDQWIRRDNRNPEILRKATVFGKEKCDAFFGPGVCDEYF